ncbi:cytochrome b [Sphingomonas humi]|uniref:Cytochrome b561 bacterial/Ni-hydrogenase domain-containing protein n=1 Tax=Sphingomonas humi TaxID=335630 RepID=A0ABP7RRC2_9SPHN
MSSATAAVHQDPVRRYSNVAATIHWITAAAVLFQIWLGFSMGEPPQANPFNWHKTVGALILLLTLGRLTYRLSNPPPPFPDDMPRWERVAAVWNHRLFYLLLLGLPLGGYLAVSAFSGGKPMTLIGGITLPTIPGIPKAYGEVFGEMHAAAAFGLIALLVVHAAAALKHRFVDKTPASGRMPPFALPHEETVVGQGGSAR